MHRSPRCILFIIGLLCVSGLIYRYGTPPAGAAAAKAEPQPPPPQPQPAQPAAAAGVLLDIAYTTPADRKNARRQTLDLYLPAKADGKPPLVIFIHGGFWALSDDDYRIGPAFAEALRPSGVAVALVRYRLAPA